MNKSPLFNSLTKMKSIQQKIEEQQDLGHGTFARVFKAQLLQTGQTVAVKKISQLLLDEEYALKQVQCLQKVESDHIVTYFHSIYDLTEQSLYIVMQLCKTSLRKQMIEKIYTQRELIDFIVQMVSAFLELMNLRLMHLDLKPQNILISQYHDDYYKICDFGCSQIAGKSKLSKYQNDVFGTFNYLAPQNYLDYKGRFTNTSADIWSLGIIIYQMIYKALPFKVDSNGLIQRKDIQSFFKDEKQIQFPVSQNSPKTIVKILRQMLVKNPKKRITWRELQKLLIKEYKIDQSCFKNVKEICVKHITILKIFLSIVIICRKNIEYNPHPFWKNQQPLLKQLCQIIVHLCHIYSIKYRAIAKYKINIKLEPEMRSILQFVETNIQFQQKLLNQQGNKKISVVTDSEFYQMSLVETAKQINEKLEEYCKEECWLAMNDLITFCNQTIACGEVSPHSFFAKGDAEFYPGSIQRLNITT